MARNNFTDIQKAQIYANDLATGAFSGKNLWLLDSGVAGTYMIGSCLKSVSDGAGGLGQVLFEV